MSLPAADDLFRPTALPDTDEAPARPEARSRARAAQPSTPAEQERPSSRRPEATPVEEVAPAGPEQSGAEQTDEELAEAADAPARRSRGRGARGTSSGRVRHDEKMTVYVTSDELLELEHARLTLRRSTGLAVDRGRLVREAVAIALADLEAHGDDSALVQRLMQA